MVGIEATGVLSMQDDVNLATRDEVLGLLRLLNISRALAGRLLDDAVSQHRIASCIERIGYEWGISEREIVHDDQVDTWLQ